MTQQLFYFIELNKKIRSSWPFRHYSLIIPWAVLGAVEVRNFRPAHYKVIASDKVVIYFVVLFSSNCDNHFFRASNNFPRFEYNTTTRQQQQQHNNNSAFLVLLTKNWACLFSHFWEFGHCSVSLSLSLTFSITPSGFTQSPAVSFSSFFAILRRFSSNCRLKIEKWDLQNAKIVSGMVGTSLHQDPGSSPSEIKAAPKQATRNSSRRLKLTSWFAAKRRHRHHRRRRHRRRVDQRRKCPQRRQRHRRARRVFFNRDQFRNQGRDTRQSEAPKTPKVKWKIHSKVAREPFKNRPKWRFFAQCVCPDPYREEHWLQRRRILKKILKKFNVWEDLVFFSQALVENLPNLLDPAWAIHCQGIGPWSEWLGPALGDRNHS